MRRPFTPPVALPGRRRRSAASPKTGFRGLLLAVPILVVGCSALRMPEKPDGALPLRETLTVSPGRPTLRIDATATLTVSARQAGQRIVEPVSWGSSRPDVVMIQGGFGTQAIVQGLTFGTSTVTATSANGLKGTAVVRVR